MSDESGMLRRSGNETTQRLIAEAHLEHWLGEVSACARLTCTENEIELARSDETAVLPVINTD